MLHNHIVTDNERQNRHIDERELLPQKVWSFDLVGKALEAYIQFLERRSLLLRVLRSEKAEKRRHDTLRNVVNPDASVGASVGVRREQVRGVRRVGIFQKFA